MPSPHKFAKDLICIQGLSLSAPLRLNGPKHKTSFIKTSLSVALSTSIARAAASDRVDLSVDYSHFSKRLLALQTWDLDFESIPTLLNRVAELALEYEGVAKVHVKIKFPKDLLAAGRLGWERIAYRDECEKGSWNVIVEGIEIPLIIGIKENVHERTQKQPVNFDLNWQDPDISCALTLSQVREHITSLISKLAITEYYSIEALTTYIAECSLSQFQPRVTVTLRKPKALKFGDAASISITRTYQPKIPIEGHEVYIALGGNLGDRLGTIEKALEILDASGVNVQEVSGLYESEPMYLEEQPQFLNAVCKVRTSLPPFELLDTLKRIEKELDRQPSVRNGPRTIDLDILLYENEIVTDETLMIPHALTLERGFVLQPLADIAPNLLHPTTFASIQSHLDALPAPKQYNYLPLRSSPLTMDPIYHRKPTLLMAILNLTPDSFSDGGKHSLDASEILETVKQMISNGAHIIDIGGHSTRPHASEVTLEQELERTIPAILAIREAGFQIPISIDTFRAEVAQAAVAAGADIINDVSAGQLDSEMFRKVAELNVPIILMHMRGTPENMNSLAKYNGDLIEIVGRELAGRVRSAVEAGIRRWNIILDPGLGFAKIGPQNVEIIKRLSELRKQEGLNGLPWLLGPSRKRFIKGVTGEMEAKERKWGTAGVIAACVQGGADIVRVHDVEEMSKVVKMCDAIWRSS